MYHFVCHDCETEATFRDLEAAQSEFNDHAERDHEVALRRVDAPSPASGSGD